MNTVALPLMWFLVIVALIPCALWLLRRTPLGGATGAGAMRTVGVLSLSPSQRLVTVEVGEGEDRRWLVLGVTAQQITTLHEMPPQGVATPQPAGTAPLPPFAQMLARLQGGGARMPGPPPSAV